MDKGMDLLGIKARAFIHCFFFLPSPCFCLLSSIIQEARWWVLFLGGTHLQTIVPVGRRVCGKILKAFREASLVSPTGCLPHYHGKEGSFFSVSSSNF